jgi:hypothetical protein
MCAIYCSMYLVNYVSRLMRGDARRATLKRPHESHEKRTTREGRARFTRTRVRELDTVGLQSVRGGRARNRRSEGVHSGTCARAGGCAAC